MQQRPLVLVVDDDRTVRELVASFLEDEGFRVATAGNGQEALAYLERQGPASMPALMVLDLHMPTMDGRELMQMLQARGIALPTVIMTGASEARETARELGAAAYIAKPLSLPLLISRIDELWPGECP